jgi:hypothetical protein
MLVPFGGRNGDSAPCDRDSEAITRLSAKPLQRLLGDVDSKRRPLSAPPNLHGFNTLPGRHPSAALEGRDGLAGLLGRPHEARRESREVLDADPFSDLALGLAPGTEDTLDALEAEALEEWERDLDPILEPLLDAVEDAKDYDDMVAMLPDVLPAMNLQQLADRLAAAGFKARAEGEVKES